MKKPYQKLKYACYASNITMSAVGNLAPLLFLTFKDLYGIPYSLLGSLVLINFFTQLTVDLIFSFFSHRFNIPKTVKSIPVIAAFGLVVFALAPTIFPNVKVLGVSAVYIGLVLGTIIFSAASGLNEVLISPVIAAIPSDDPDREMSKLHSIYAWGVVGVVVLSTAYLSIPGINWQWLPVILTVIPLTSSLLYIGSPLPKMQTAERASGAFKFLKNSGVMIFIVGIFLGGASECIMAQWASSYAERALAIPKAAGDIFGAALFAVALGIGRSLYAKIGKNVERVLCLGSLSAVLCYLIASLCPIPVVGLLACALTGFCVSMLWPGSLIAAEHKLPAGGVVMYAMMAAGGDLGASVGPQLVGVITDTAIAVPQISSFANTLGMTADQLGMRLGILIGAAFPLAAFFLFLVLIRRMKGGSKNEA
jgi:MFS family permease